MFGVCGSAVIYMLSYYAVGVASDFRYAYWAVVAGLVGGVVVASGGGKASWADGAERLYCFGSADAVQVL